MTDIVQSTRIPVDLRAGAALLPLRTKLMKDDRHANRVIAVITDGGMEVDLSGCEAKGSFFRPGDRAEIRLAGEIGKNEVSVQLTDACYTEDGSYELRIKLAKDGVERTILCISGDVHASGSGAYLNVDNVIPSIDDIIAQYQTMQAVTEDTRAAAARAEEAAERAENAGIDEEKIESAIKDYLEENPVGGVDEEELAAAVEAALTEALEPLNAKNAKQDEEIEKRAKDADLAAVAKSGSYNDLKDAPKIPVVPEWAMHETKPTYTAAEVKADPAGTAAQAVGNHNTDAAAHNDLRAELQALNARLNAFFDSDDATLDELSEIVAYIKSNKALIDAITTSKVSVSDIVNDLVTNIANRPLSAAQGVVLKALIDAITVPTKLSELAGDATHRVVTDAEKAAWNAKLDTSKLPEAVEDALAQAKASGEFDGKDGEPGEPGEPGTSITVKSVSESGEDGGSNIVTFSDGKTVTVKNGRKGSQGEPGKDANVTAANIKSALGYTPASETAVSQLSAKIDAIGTQEDIVQQVIAVLGTPVFGTVDADKNITLSGTLKDGTYTIVYENADGKITQIGTLNIGDGRLVNVNLIPLSINTDGTPYVGTNGEAGYKEGYRLNSGGTETQKTKMYVTGFMPVETGDTVVLDDVGWSAYDGSNNYYCYLTLYDGSFSVLGYTTADKFKASSTTISGLVSNGVFVQDATVGAGDHLRSFVVIKENTKYMRLSATAMSASSSIMVAE